MGFDRHRRSLKDVDEKVLFSRSKFCLLKHCGEGIIDGPVGGKTLMRNDGVGGERVR